MPVNIQEVKRVHFIGITSSFNSFCASYLLNAGINVTASQHNQNSEDAQYWLDQGILFPGEHSAEFIHQDLDLVILPNGPVPNNPEIIRAEELGISTITIGKLTGLILEQYKTIAVVGTHGKTTTAALISWFFYANGIEPNFIIGGTNGKIGQVNTNWNFNPDSEYVVLEACEYKEQFLDRAPNPFISVVTHIDLDHTDYFPDENAYNSAFVKFLSNTQHAIVIDTFGENESSVIEDVLRINKTADVWDVSSYRVKIPEIQSPLFGEHNRQNMLRAYIAGEIIGFSTQEMVHAFETFPGIGERFEFVGAMESGALVYKDYAHNPEKVAACIQGAREAHPNKKIIFVFQPHSYERTYTFMDQFAKSLSDADVVVIPDIFIPSREPEEFLSLTSPSEFVLALRTENPEMEIHYTESLDNTPELLHEISDDNSVVVVASAGDLFKIISDLV